MPRHVRSSAFRSAAQNPFPQPAVVRCLLAGHETGVAAERLFGVDGFGILVFIVGLSDPDDPRRRPKDPLGPGGPRTRETDDEDRPLVVDWHCSHRPTSAFIGWHPAMRPKGSRSRTLYILPSRRGGWPVRPARQQQVGASGVSAVSDCRTRSSIPRFDENADRRW